MLPSPSILTIVFCPLHLTIPDSYNFSLIQCLAKESKFGSRLTSIEKHLVDMRSEGDLQSNCMLRRTEEKLEKL